MPATTREWPAWPEFTAQDAESTKDPDFLSIKKSLIAEYGAETLRQSWIKVCRELQVVTNEILEKGNEIIPIFDTAEVISKGFTSSQKAEIQRIGAFICRATIPETETDTLYQDMTKYVADNKASIQAWPKESPSMLILYNSPTQIKIRSNPNHLMLQRKLNELWHGYNAAEHTSPEPLAYLDGLRDRAPGQPFLGLGPHIDAGSFCRWADPAYRKVYDNIFRGRPEAHDAFDIGLRKDADQELYKAMAHSTVLRTFQGWTALTPTAPREGTIMIYPNLKYVIAYMLLRPFFQPPKDKHADVMDPETWTLDEETGWFPGTFKTQSQRLSRVSHPHLRLEECLVHMPKVRPGDTVWWHCDVCHAVDTEHLGKVNASVAFIGACPTTPINKDYIRRQLAATLEGRAPPDYAIDGETDLDERKLKGYVGFDGLSNDARRAFGFELL
ncbi:hypothetical protein IAQ61_007700 [Plenodomus lingam]|uniref:Similar to DUF1479 domain protein n=1 Tax=Leptosphaeria maculans (strain JN3 / isolate v23.1.3 / race Av1-4-5-6-7-8) TaxID=985895 RepID=E5A4Y3_LEPMJ|nr:similar to DUF1479 domain protein [Plenodomus lingam JN3]KAH9867108.1 hypothetical protein IAQ61_007700 [Plenodomus lingam]CBX98681.1 similar to DUF1479 domain protein [Plenodomus lingam JN3]